ncbi:MAG TPA: alpha/beta hydrolase [Candidatus Eisenbacteria bacterium]|nr:alpha/beta hydrolase [Candidatus Eisenbacteria bacterium]
MSGGEPVVFIHGLFQAMAPLADIPFPSPRKRILLDLPGYGAHVDTALPSDLAGYADHVASELDRLGASPAFVVGHSVGGAVSMLLAANHRDRVVAVVNAEGNFRPADAFWSSKIAAMTSDEVEAMLDGYKADVDAWLTRQKIQIKPKRQEWAKRMFDAQRARSVQALARAVVEASASPDYLPTMDGVLLSGIPVHLIAGERSRAGWGVPDDFARLAASFSIQPKVGHMMMLEEPEAFLKLVASQTG